MVAAVFHTSARFEGGRRREGEVVADVVGGENKRRWTRCHWRRFQSPVSAGVVAQPASQISISNIWPIPAEILVQFKAYTDILDRT